MMAGIYSYIALIAFLTLCDAGEPPVPCSLGCPAAPTIEAAGDQDEEDIGLLQLSPPAKMEPEPAPEMQMGPLPDPSQSILPTLAPTPAASPPTVPNVLDALKACLRSRLPSSTDLEYPAAEALQGHQPPTNALWKLHNQRVATQMRPVAVVFAETPDEVAAASSCASMLSLSVSGQSGRHSYLAYCTQGCVLVNVFKMKRVNIDQNSDTAWLGAGLNLGQAYTYLAKQGYTIPGGTCPTVGLAGLTLGGGKGILTRMHGLLIDKLIGVKVVLSNGTKLTATSHSHPELLWLAKGGGGNTYPGVVTEFRFKLVPAMNIISEWEATWDFDCLSGKQCRASDAFNLWQRNYLVHPDRRVYVRFEIHPYSEPHLNLNYNNPNQPHNTTRAHIKMSFKFLGLTQEESEPYVGIALRELGMPSNADGKNPRTLGVWNTYSYIESLQRGGGIGMAGGKSCKKWVEGLTKDEAEAEMIRSLPPYCGWDSGYDTSFLYRALVMQPLSETATREFFDTVSEAPSFDPKDESWRFYLQIDPSNGAAGDVKSTDTAYPWRGGDDMTLQVIAKWPNSEHFPHHTLETLNHHIIGVLQPFVGTRSYYNYADDNMPGGAIPLFSYFGANAPRVLAIRRKYMDLRPVSGNEWELLAFRQNQTSGVQPWMNEVRGVTPNMGADVITAGMLKTFSREGMVEASIDLVDDTSVERSSEPEESTKPGGLQQKRE